MTIADFFKKDRELQKTSPVSGRPVKVALLSSFTTKGMKEVLHVKCAELGISAEFYEGSYNQYAQEILDPASGLYKFQGDLVFLFIDTRTLFEDKVFSFYDLNPGQRSEFIQKKFDELANLVGTLKNNFQGKIVMHNFEVSTLSPMGILENKQTPGLRSSVNDLNRRLEEKYATDTQVFVFDFEEFSSKFGKDRIFNYKMYYLADIKIDLETIPSLVNEYLRYIKPLLGMTKKCLVLDLDNVLWGGVVGEEGALGIKLGPTPEGRPFWELQKYLLSLHKRGIILAINSKNNPEDIAEVFAKNEYMILREKHFAAAEINWNDKATNMRAIIADLNIGAESLVFIDDDRFNQDLIKTEFPEIKVVDLPADPALYLKTIADLDAFETFALTAEDLKKGEMYAQERQRKKIRADVANIDEYLEKLQIQVTIEAANEETIPRIAQLTQKTNQFNMTTRRYQIEDIKSFVADANYGVWAVKVKDNLGDYGLTGAAIVKKNLHFWEIDTFLLSCRVIGRRVEDTLLAFLVENAKKAGVKKLKAEFISTRKNLPARDFYKNSKFTLVSEKDNIQIWEYNI